MLLDKDHIYELLAQDFNLPEDDLVELLQTAGMTNIKNQNRYTRAYFQSLARYHSFVKLKDDFERNFIPDQKSTSLEDYIQQIKHNNDSLGGNYRNAANDITTKMFLVDLGYDLGDYKAPYAFLLSLIDQAKQFAISFQNYILTVSTRLDIINTTDPTGVCIQDTITKWNKFYKEHSCKELRTELGIFSNKPSECPISKQLAINVVKSRSNVWRQRVMIEMRDCIQNGWYVVFDTLTLDDRMLKSFAEDKNALRDYFRNIGRQVNLACGSKLKDSFSDKYRYFCVPEYGSENGRLHWHVVHLLKELPKGCADPNHFAARMGRPCINTEISWFKKQFKYGVTRPVAVRYIGDSYSNKLGWINPVDKKTGKTVEKGHWIRVAYYVTKYVTKKQDLDVKRHSSNKGTLWHSILTRFNQTDFRIRATRGFGQNLLSMENLSNKTLVELTQLDPKLCQVPTLVKKKAAKELSTRICNTYSTAQIQITAPATINLIELMRSMQELAPHITTMEIGALLTKTIPLEVTSNEVIEYLQHARLTREHFTDRC